MTVDELISILKCLDPTAVVVVPTNDDNSNFHTVLELQSDRVQFVNLRVVETNRSWFDPDHGAQFFVAEEGGLVAGVEIG